LFAVAADAPSGTSTRPVVPRMPSVAVGVDIFMSPVLATAAATKATVPLAMSNDAAFCLPPSSYTKLSTVIFALAVRLKVVASLKVTPKVELTDVCSTSSRKMSSCNLSGVEALFRVTVALAGQRRDISDRLVGCCLVRRGRSCRRRRRLRLRKSCSVGHRARRDRHRSNFCG